MSPHSARQPGQPGQPALPGQPGMPGMPGMPPSQALRLAVAALLLGIVVVLAAGADPWLLVLLVWLGVTTYTVYDRTGDGWVLTI